LIVKVKIMNDKRHSSSSETEARRTFRASDGKGAVTEYEKEQRARYKNFERLRAERLAREATKPKDN
jgi:hypothetical protein